MAHAASAMPDFRAHAPNASPESQEIRLDAGESHHLVTVNRCQRGDPVVAFDGRGREWVCTCLDPARAGALLGVRSTRMAAPRPHALTLAQALPKGAVMEEIVRQATELGAVRLRPLRSERTQVHLNADRAEKKTARWRSTAIEAAKQCGNPWLPEILPPQEFSEVLAAECDQDLRLIASLHSGTHPLKNVLAQYRARHGRAPHRVLWFVGPEGDFSPAEMTAAVLAGVVPVTLGPLVLRCDTAAVAALSILGHELGG